MINPSISQAVAAERRADLRREAARQRFSRTVSRRRHPARHGEVSKPMPIPAPRTSAAEHADAPHAQDLCLTSRH
jgi:hypothetical protein